MKDKKKKDNKDRKDSERQEEKGHLTCTGTWNFSRCPCAAHRVDHRPDLPGAGIDYGSSGEGRASRTIPRPPEPQNGTGRLPIGINRRISGLAGKHPRWYPERLR